MSYPRLQGSLHRARAPLLQRKGNRQTCDNHRGTPLLSIAGKILARVLLNRFTQHLERGHLPESQSGFRAKRGRVNMIFAASQLQDARNKTGTSISPTLDIIIREGLWKIIAKFGCPDLSSSPLVRQFHDDMMACVQGNGGTFVPFPVISGVGTVY